MTNSAAARAALPLSPWKPKRAQMHRPGLNGKDLDGRALTVNESPSGDARAAVRWRYGGGGGGGTAGRGRGAVANTPIMLVRSCERQASRPVSKVRPFPYA